MTKQELLDNIDKQIIELGTQRNKLRQKIQAEEYGVKPGDIVEYKGRKYQITGFDMYWPVGKRIRKDGTPAVLNTNLYNFPKLK